jgi:Zn-dependent protease
VHQSIRLGRVAGIPIGANWSVLVIGWLLAWALATQLLPAAVDHQSAGARWVVAGVAVLAFFASLLTHELGHSLVARRHGVEVRSITLWLFGGVAQLEHDTTSPSTEVKVAVTGPLVSAGLALGFAVLAVAVELAIGWDLAVTALAWLAWINLLLALFNVLPAFPLDGGRVLRGILWKRWDDRLRATVTAAKVGAGFAYGLVALGVLAMTSGLFINGLWFLFLGWFLLGAARAEQAAVQQDELLGGVRAADVMTPEPVTLEADTNLAEAVDHELLYQRHATYPVLEAGGGVVGLLTLAGIQAIPRPRRSQFTVGAACTPLSEVVVCTPDAPAAELIRLLGPHPVGRALVMDGAVLKGIVARSDLVGALAVRAAAH